MRISLGPALCISVVLWAGSTAADTFYKYRDQATRRDVFVNRLEQVPHKYRAQAQIVLDGTDTATTEPAPSVADERIEVAPDTHRPTLRTVTPPPSPAEQLRKAVAGNPLRTLPVLAATVVDLKLAEKGGMPLYPNERASLGELLVAVLVASLVAALAALVAWVVILVTALRDGRPWWALFIFLFWPIGYVYVFRHGGKGRMVWKSLCTLAMLAPALVGLVAAWRVHAWLAAVIQARGGQL